MNIMRNHFTIGMAGLILDIDTISPCVCIHCMDYLKEGNPDFRIKVTEEDLQQELLISQGIKHNSVSLEIAAAYRKISEQLLDHDFILMHGAVISVEGKAFMFSAPSGTGKTTHIRLWLKNRADSFVVNGDKPLIKVEQDQLIACGTPWSGKEHWNTNIMVPLQAIVFLERSEDNSIEKLTFSQAYPYLIQQTYIPYDKEKAKKTLALLASIYRKSTFWRFKCNNYKDDCFNTSYKALMSDG